MNRRSFIKTIAAATAAPLALLKAKLAIKPVATGGFQSIPFPSTACTHTNVESTELTLEMLQETMKKLHDNTEYPYGPKPIQHRDTPIEILAKKPAGSYCGFLDPGWQSEAMRLARQCPSRLQKHVTII